MSASAAAAVGDSGPWSPLKHRVFLIIWGSMLASNVGMWVRDVASGWLMTEMSQSALLVALVQAALMLPVFLLAMPAGALADIVDRRRMLIAVQSLILLVSVALAAAVVLGVMTPTVLLSLTFVGGIGAALLQPAFQAVVPELVPKDQLRPAVALNSISINIARATGPALGGAILVAGGVAAAYIFDALSSLIVIAAFVWWRRASAPRSMPPESFFPAMRTGFRYATRSGDLQRVLIRAAAFFLFGSAYWALLPLIARDLLQAEASFYGLMLTSIGAGAVAGALVLPRLQRGRAPGTIVFIGNLLTTSVIAVLALAPSQGLTLSVLFLAGAAWIAVLTNLNVAAQSSLPNWIRARGMAVYLMVFYGAMSGGSALWGQTAQMTSLSTALLLAAGLGAVAAMLALPVGLPRGDSDLSPSGHWPEPPLAMPIAGERGPVMITIEWRITPADRDAFLAAAMDFATRRERDGAFGWRIYEDAENPERFVEVFLAHSWFEHLRQHERITEADRAAQEALQAFHLGPERPHVTHLLAAKPGDTRPAAELKLIGKSS